MFLEVKNKTLSSLWGGVFFSGSLHPNWSSFPNWFNKKRERGGDMPGTNIRSKTSWLLHRKGQLFVYCTVQYIFLCFRETASPKKRLSRCLPLSSGISEFLSEKRGFFSSQPHIVFSRLKFQVQIIKFYFYFKNGKSRVFC